MRVIILTLLFPAIALAQSGRSDMVLTAFDQPCRIIDTRLTFEGAIQGGSSRSFHVAGTGGFNVQGGTAGGCGVPTTATAALINFVAVNPTGGGNLRGAAFPSDPPAVGSIINYQALFPNLNIANAMLFPICDRSGISTCTFDITILANGAGTHLVADVVGYAVRANQQIVVVRAGPQAFPNGNALFAAHDGITGQSATSRYLLKLEPGIYETYNQLNLKPFVSIEGSGMDETIIRRIGPGSAPAVFSLGNSSIRHLTIEDVTTDNDVVALATGGGEPTNIEYVRLRAVGGLTQAYGLNAVSGAAASPRLDHVTIEVDSTATNAIGIRTGTNSYMTVANSSITLTGSAGSKVGVEANGPMDFRNVEIFVGGTGTSHTGMSFGTGGFPVLRDVRVSANLASINRGITAWGINASGLTVGARFGNVNYAIELDADLGTIITDSTISAVDGAVGNYGINITDASNGNPVDLRTLQIFVRNGVTGAGIYMTGGTALLDRSTIISGLLNSLSPATSGTIMRVGGSKLAGPVSVAAGATLTCVHSYNGNYAPLGPGCT